MIKNKENLSCLCPGEYAVIKSLENKGSMRRRLMDLGFAKGSKTACIGVAPFGDPKAFLIKNTVIALREEDSSLIKI
jgi:ferrous iron transport protein A